MRAPISIVILTGAGGAVQGASALAATLASLGIGLQAGLIREVLVCAGDPDPNVALLAEASGARMAAGDLAAVLHSAGGGWVLIVQAGSVLADGWAEVALSHLVSTPALAARYALKRTKLRRFLARLQGAGGSPNGLLVPRARWGGLTVPGGWRGPLRPLAADLIITKGF